MKNQTFEMTPITGVIKVGIRKYFKHNRKIRLEKIVNVDEVPLNEYNIALVNYMNRRDFIAPSIAYYGHTKDNLGYFIGIDEVKIWRTK